MIAFAICAALGCVPTLLLHEFAHVVVFRLAGARVESFRPWPHRHDGRWYFGRVVADRALDARWALRSACAPLAKANAMLALWLVLAATTGIWALGLALWEAIDVANWWQGWIRQRPNDGGRARRLLTEAQI